MKKIILSLVCFFALAANAQTIHWLTFIDTNDENVGQIDVNGRKVLYNHFINVVNSALTEKGYNSDIHDIYGNDLSPERCKMEVQNLKCQPEDIVVFYYIGHGTHSPYDDNPYPQMLLGSVDQNKFIPLKWTHEELLSKGARLTVTIGMCCNVIQAVSAKKGPQFAVNYGNVQLTENEKRSIQNMFLGSKGDFLLSSASVGESSIGSDTPFGPMDLFTASLVCCFEDMSYEGELEWNDLFSQVKAIVYELTGGQQTPFWANNLTSAAVPNNRTTPAPEPKPVKEEVASNRNEQPKQTEATALDINDPGQVANYLSKYFDFIIDSRNSAALRRAKMQELEGFFTSNAVVRMLPQDGNVVIDREGIDEFLGRISTSRILLKIVPVAYRTDGQRIVELRVKECYNK